jgi:flagellar motor switch protein FliN
MAQDNELTNQDDIERLLQQAQTGPRSEGRSGESPKPSRPESPLGKGPALSAAATPSLASAGDTDKVIAQDDIERLLNQPGKPAAPPLKSAAKEKPGQNPLPGEGEPVPDDIEYLLQQAEQALASVDAEPDGPPPGVAPFRFQEFAGAPASSENATLDLIRDVELDLRIELGRTNLYLEDVLKLRKGSVVPLDKLAGDPVDIYVNGRLIARGEVLVLNDNFCVRVTELIAGENPAA